MPTATTSPPRENLVRGIHPGIEMRDTGAKMPTLVGRFAIFNADGVCCCGTNTHIDGATATAQAGESLIQLRIEALHLVEGFYRVDVAVHSRSGMPYDYHRQLHSFRVQASTRAAGVFRPPHRWAASGGVVLAGPNGSEGVDA